MGKFHIQKRYKESQGKFGNGILLAALFTCLVFLSYETTNAVVTNARVGERDLPIYCVDTTEKKVALSFDAAWGAEDFQKKEDGTFDTEYTDPILIELFCSSCWHDDGEYSPRGWSKDACVSGNRKLIDLEHIAAPTLLLYGTRDPYMNRDLLQKAPDLLPEGSKLQAIEGGSHIMMYEKPCYRQFQEAIVHFLNS